MDISSLLLYFADHPVVLALAGTVLVPFFILVLGLVMELLADAITAFIGLFTGGLIAFGIRTYATYLGTVIHEFSHAFFAVLTGAKVNKITLIPKGMTLGSVEYTPRGNKFLQGLQKSLSAVAPTIVGTVLLALLFLKDHPLLTEVWHYILFYYLALSILFHMDLSFADLRSFASGLPSFLLLSLVVSVLLVVLVGTEPLTELAKTITNAQQSTATHTLSQTT